MGLANCPECGKLYLETPRRLCPDCAAQEEADEDKVAQFLRTVERASLDEIHEATGVKHKTILKMIQRGRLVNGGRIEYPCEVCGEPITEGRLCNHCLKNIAGQAPQKSWTPPARPQETALGNQRMYTKDLFRK